MTRSLPSALAAAVQAANRTRAELGDVSARHRAARSHLADEIRRTASSQFGSVDALCELVEAQSAESGRRIPARTVRNALYQTLVESHLAACVDALDDAFGNADADDEPAPESA